MLDGIDLILAPEHAWRIESAVGAVECEQRIADHLERLRIPLGHLEGTNAPLRDLDCVLERMGGFEVGGIALVHEDAHGHVDTTRADLVFGERVWAGLINALGHEATGRPLSALES